MGKENKRQKKMNKYNLKKHIQNKTKQKQKGEKKES